MKKILMVVALVFLMVGLFVPLVFGQDGGTYVPPTSTAAVIVMVTMLVQWLGSFFAAKSFGIVARKMLPVINFVISLVSQLLAAFATGLGPAPITPAEHNMLSAYQAAGFFGSFGKTFLDVFINSVIQTLVVVGGHSAPKNVKEGIELAKEQKRVERAGR